MAGELVVRNIVFVSYDSTRADVAYSGKFSGIEKLRAQGVTFHNCVASAPLTPVSHASVMTGLHPYRHGIRHLFREKLDKSCVTIASVLKDKGYETSAVVSCPGLHRWYEIGRGFDIYDDELPLLPGGGDPLQTVDVKLRGQSLKRADSVIERSKTIINNVPFGQPFFHFIHFFDAHWPYAAPKSLGTVVPSNAYEEEVAFLDYHFSEWLAWMQDNGHLHDTLIVLFGDHGEDLNGWYPNDKGGEKLGHPEEMGHGCLLHDQTILVPLVFWHERLERLEVTAQVRLVDVFPTVFELAEIKTDHVVDGVSLAPVIQGVGEISSRIGYSETFYPVEQTESTGAFDWTRNKKAIRINNRYKVIWQLNSDELEVYDLLSDPQELINLQGFSSGTPYGT